jgi:predicted DNA-binding transcriptional regulator AlpA
MQHRHHLRMTKPRKRDELGRPFPPDYVSAETLAHRLDCSLTTIRCYVQRGLLPRPIKLGDLVRWRWRDVEHFLHALELTEESLDNDDPYLVPLIDGPAKRNVD